MGDEALRLAYLRQALSLHDMASPGTASASYTAVDGVVHPACLICAEHTLCRDECPNAPRMVDLRATFNYLCASAGGTAPPVRASRAAIEAGLASLREATPAAFPGELYAHMLSAERQHDWSARSIVDIIVGREDWVRAVVASYTDELDEKRRVIGQRALDAFFSGSFARLMRSDLAVINNAIEDIDPAEVDLATRGDIAKLLVLVIALYSAMDKVSESREMAARQSLEREEAPDSWGVNVDHVENGPAHPAPRDGALTLVCASSRRPGTDFTADPRALRRACEASFAAQGVRIPPEDESGSKVGGEGGDGDDEDDGGELDDGNGGVAALDAQGNLAALVGFAFADNMDVAVTVHVAPGSGLDVGRLQADLVRSLALALPTDGNPVATCSIRHYRTEGAVGGYVLETATGCSASAWDSQGRAVDFSTKFVLRLAHDETRDGYPRLARGTAVARALLCYRNGEMSMFGPTLEHLCVRRDMRRRGLGRLLMGCVEEFVLRSWFPTLPSALLQATYVTGGQGFFRRMGFRFVDEPLYEEAQKELGRSFACTCRGCIGGCLSPRMRFRLMQEADWQHVTLSDAVTDALVDAEADGTPETDAAVDGEELPLSARFLPSMGPLVPANVIRGYASIFAALHAFLENGHVLPDARNVREVCMSHGRGRRGAGDGRTAAIAAFEAASGRVEDAIAALVDITEEQSTGQTESDFLVNFGDDLAALPECAHDGCYRAVRVLLAGMSAPSRRPHAGYSDGMDMDGEGGGLLNTSAHGLMAALAGMARARVGEDTGDDGDDVDGAADDGDGGVEEAWTSSNASLVARIVQGAMRGVRPPVSSVQAAVPSTTASTANADNHVRDEPLD